MAIQVGLIMTGVLIHIIMGGFQYGIGSLAGVADCGAENIALCGTPLEPLLTKLNEPREIGSNPLTVVIRVAGIISSSLMVLIEVVLMDYAILESSGVLGIPLLLIRAAGGLISFGMLISVGVAIIQAFR